jgi:hypothetical protein
MFQDDSSFESCKMNSMDSRDDANSLAALKESIRESELSLRQMKETIETVDARLKQAGTERQRTTPVKKQSTTI